jgi:hypothetical protein
MVAQLERRRSLPEESAGQVGVDAVNVARREWFEEVAASGIQLGDLGEQGRF